MRTIRYASILVTGLALQTVFALGEEAVRTLRAELPAGSRFSVENLVGTMRISEASVPSITAVATVHAESPALADAVRLERIPGSDGGVTLRVRYPYDKVGTFRYREPGSHDEWNFGFASSSQYEYDGRSVRVSRSRGTRLHADVEVSLAMHTTSGDLTVRSVKARKIAIETNSGDARFTDADVEEFRAEATSGDIALSDVDSRLRAIDIVTSSGDVVLRLPPDAGFEATASQSSGDMRVGFFDGTSVTKGDSLVAYRRGDHRARIRVKTSSGDFSISPM